MIRSPRLFIAAAIAATTTLIAAGASSAGASVNGSGIIPLSAPDYGSMLTANPPIFPNQPVLGLASDAAGDGYWMVASDGGVFTFGNAQFYGSMGGKPLNQPMVGMAPHGSAGYWTFAGDGGVFTFGDAQFYGSMGGKPLNAPVVAMIPTANGKGYLLVAADGGVFTFGDATFLGSTGSNPPASPIAGGAVLPDGSGYWIFTRAGQVIPFGTATNLGDLTAFTLTQPVVGMAATPDGKGYWLAQADGQVWKFGTATISEGAQCLVQPVVALAAQPMGPGLWLATAPRPALKLNGLNQIAVLDQENADIAAMLKIRQACEGQAAVNSIAWVRPIPGAPVTELYGWRIHPIFHVPEFHRGIDLGGTNTRIGAAAAGRVVEVGYRVGYGNVVIIDHGSSGTKPGGRIATLYAHMSKTTVTVGQDVNAGDQVGVMGATGYATAPHLHFEIRVNGDTVDPLPYLAP